MYKSTNYYYKGYDITSKNRLEKLMYEYSNPYGYNIESNQKRNIDYDYLVTHTNQDFVKNKEYLGKR